MVKITDVEPHSLAKKHGICAGDFLLEINGNEICDVLDYRFYLTEERVKLLFRRGENDYTVDIKKGQYDDIGLEFETPLMDEKHSCTNKCIFCFIDQNPSGLRDSLYFKDDDSRLSFIHGNYITLTNMKQKDIDRIIKMRFSPINISVHTTNPELRVKMMKNRFAGDVLKYLDDLFQNGISMCGQIVLCKGVNDGEELKRTLTDLSKYYPLMNSVAVVPAGITKYRDNLYPITDFNKDEAMEVIRLVNNFGDRHLLQKGSRMFYVADEFYLKAGIDIPKEEYYEDYSQIENGVGMLRSFSEEFNAGVEDSTEEIKSLKAKRRIAVATGVASYELMFGLSEKLMSINKNIEIDVYRIINNFYGPTITVSGLLTGKDIYEQLRGKLDAELLILPASALRREEQDFLCGMKLFELEELLGVKIRLCENNGYDFVEAVLGD